MIFPWATDVKFNDFSMMFSFLQISRTFREIQWFFHDLETDLNFNHFSWAVGTLQIQYIGDFHWQKSQTNPELFPSTEVQSSCSHCLHTWHWIIISPDRQLTSNASSHIMQFKLSFPPSFWTTHYKQYYMHIYTCIYTETERKTKR